MVEQSPAVILPAAHATSWEIAPAGRRLGAVIVDTVTLIFGMVILMIPFVPASFAVGMSAETAGMYFNIIGLGVNIAYYLVFWMATGATPGKTLLGIKVIDSRTGQAPRLSCAILRYLGMILSSMALGLGFLWILFNKERKGWHDMLAHTVVIMRPDDSSERA